MNDSLLPDPPGAADLRDAFAATLGTHLAHMRAALGRADLAAVQAIAHTLSGSAATFGSPGVGQAAAGLEQACRNADRAAVIAAFGRLCDAAKADSPVDHGGKSVQENMTDASLPPLILLVDDDTLLLAALARALDAGGFRVQTAASGSQALALLRSCRQPPHLAVLDITMPDMSGLDLATRLDGVPCMFLSASSDADIAAQAADGGAVGYLLKPIDPSQLLPAVRAALARAAEIQDLRAAEQRLTQALRDGRETGMAVGLLMERYRIDRHGALRMLRHHARSSQRKLNDVAAELLQAAETMNAFAMPKPELPASRPRLPERGK